MNSFSEFFASFEFFVLNKIYTKNTFWYRFIPVLFILFITYTILLSLNSGFLTILFKQFYLDVFQKKSQEGFFWQAIVDQGSHLFDQSQSQFFKDHLSSRKFRIVIPILSKLFHLSPIKLFFLQILAGLLFANLLLKYLTELLKDKFLAFLALLAIENTYIGASFFINFYGHMDGFTYLFLLLALIFFHKPILASIFLQLSFWSDERSLFAALPILLISCFLHGHQLKSIISRIVELLINYLIYLILYLYIGYSFKIGPIYSPDSSNFNNHIQNVMDLINWFGFKLFDALESFWIIILMAFYFLVSKTSYQFEKLIFILYFGCIMAINLLVADTSRSLGFAFLLILYSLLILSEKLERGFLKEILYVVAIISILQPIVFP